MDIQIYDDKMEMGEMAAAHCAGIINRSIREKSSARIILATGASQFSFLDCLVKMSVPWNKVTCFHLDEYVNLSPEHPASFRRYLQDRVWSKVTPKMGNVHMLDPEAIDKYQQLVMEDEIDLACIGIGENGHIAFNDPAVADFNDDKTVKIVELDEECRKQQLGEGWFPNIESVPTKAATLTIPAITRSKHLSVFVPDERKAVAVSKALLGDISTACPASILRKCVNVVLWLDKYAHSLYGKQIEKPLIPDGDVTFPGLVDIQVNGYRGISFSDIGLSHESFRKTCYEILGSFAFMFIPTIITSDLSVYDHVLPIMADVIEGDDELKTRIPGIHLEGPFLSGQDGANGCHDPQYLHAPRIDLLDKWQRLARGKIVLMTIAAELGGAEKFTQYAAAAGIKVCLGHQVAGYKDMGNLVKAGASLITHFGNGAPKFLPRQDNVILAGLAEEKLSVSLITDGRHIPDELIELVLKIKGFDKTIIVSDVAPAAGQAPGQYTMYSKGVVLTEDGFLRMEDTGVMAGSAYNTLQCANYLIKRKLVTSVHDLEKLCFTNPLKLLGINPEYAKKTYKHLLRIEKGCLIYKKPLSQRGINW